MPDFWRVIGKLKTWCSGRHAADSRLEFDAKLVPQFIDPLFHRLAHDNGVAPLTLGFPRPLICRIEANFGAQAQTPVRQSPDSR